jgi:hypothetical protein
MATGNGTEMKDRPVNTTYYQRAMSQTFWNEDKTASGDDVLPVLQP